MKSCSLFVLCAVTGWAYSVPSRAPRPTKLSSDLTDDPDISRILQEQGISINELMGLRRSLMEDTSSDAPSDRRRVSMKKKPIKEKTPPVPNSDDFAVDRPSSVVTSEPAPSRVKPMKDIAANEVASSLKPFPVTSAPSVRKVSAPVANDRGSALSIGGSGSGERSRRLEVDMSGVTLQQQLEFLVEELGFPTLFEETGMRCFANAPSIRSSLKLILCKNL